MKKTDFDAFSSDYNSILQNQLNFFEGDEGYFAEYKVKLTKMFFPTPQQDASPFSILDFGCGIGRSIPYFRQHFPHATLFGADTSEKSLEVARQQFPYAHFLSKREIDDCPTRFDCIFLAGVLHHIAPEARIATLAHLSKRLSSHGKIIIFEHNPYNPITRHLVNTCPFDEDAILLTAHHTRKLLRLAGLQHTQQQYTLFFPQRLRVMRPLEKYLGFLPLGGQYVIAGSHT